MIQSAVSLWLVPTTRAQAMSAPEEEVDGVRSCFQAGREPTSWLSWSLPQVVWGMTGTNSFWNILPTRWLSLVYVLLWVRPHQTLLDVGVRRRLEERQLGPMLGGVVKRNQAHWPCR